jgi:hypothetical protein
MYRGTNSTGVATLSLQQIARALGGEVCGNQVSAPGPGHSPKDRSLSIKLDASAPEGFVVYSFAGDEAICCRDYIREKLGLPPWNGNAMGAPAAKTIVATYDYTDEAGGLLFQVVRYTPKGFRQRRPDGSGGWIWSLGETSRVLYRLPEVVEAVALERTIFIAEGEKTVDALVGLGVPATCSAGGAGKWRDEYSQYLADANVVILPDKDEPGEGHCEAVAKSLAGVSAGVGDAFDWVQAGGTAEQLWQLVETDAVDPDAPQSRLCPLCIHELFGIEIPEREMILNPILPQKGLAMLYAVRGIGKTHLACAISYAVATGTKFLKWDATKPRKVLHCDGEMPAVALRERFDQIMRGASAKPEPSMLNILSADLIDLGIGNLASLEVQAELDPLLDGVELLVLDNLSSLTSVIRDNDAESWGPIQEWLLRLRRRGVSVLIVHHAGKGGEQRGTSRREDVLDTSISLRRPSDYSAPQGARFEVHLEKARGIHGDRAKPFEAHLEVLDGAVHWSVRDIEDVNLARVKALVDDGLTVREIADETGIPRSTVGRLKKQIEAEAAAKKPLDAAA